MTALYLTPPTTSTPYPTELASGSVVLYADPNWTSTSYTITTGSSIEGRQYPFSGTSLNDQATWLAFNLPTGVVMTLLQNPTTPDPTQPYNFANAGVCVDLIGNGQTQTVDLKALGANDCLSAYIWRRVNFDDGLFQLFDGADYTGNRNTFFLGEWAKDTIHTLKDWFICDRAASIYFGSLTAQSFTLFDGGNGEGASVSFAGWLDIHEVNNLGPYSFNDREGSWSWALLTPLYATVSPFTLVVPAADDPSLTITNAINGVNQGSATLVDKVTVTSANQQSLTLSVTDSHTIGSVESVKFTYGEKDVAQLQVSCSFSQSYTYSGTKTTVVTETITLEVEQDVSVPANCQYESTLVIQFAAIDQTAFSTSGVFYYSQPVPGSTYDATMSDNLRQPVYALNQTVTGTIGGGIALNTTSSTVTTPLS
ncbi:hypothetical protein [Azospirillum sp. B4]|uniref:hypothetical protein n=1 Tax=Azospirillum sp. B4 TaxID=95605 RepID=UPI00034C0E63|nr:hypothetical protein [Azospirillum sp. B4]